MIKFTNEIALITAVSDLRMFLDNVKGFTALFCRINSRSVAEKSPSGPINIQKDLTFLRSSTFKFSFEYWALKGADGIIKKSVHIENKEDLYLLKQKGDVIEKLSYNGCPRHSQPSNEEDDDEFKL